VRGFCRGHETQVSTYKIWRSECTAYLRARSCVRLSVRLCVCVGAFVCVWVGGWVGAGGKLGKAS